MRLKIFQNLFVFILLSQIANVDCDIKAMATRNKNTTTTIANETFGWGGPPELLRDGKNPIQSQIKEYFYLKSEGRASQKAIEQNSDSLMITTCSDAASLDGAHQILSSFMDAHIQELRGSDETGTVTLRVDENKSYTCKYSQTEDKKAKSKECSGKIQNRGTALCWSTQPGGTWESCACLSYIRFPGGKDSVLKKLEFSE